MNQMVGGFDKTIADVGETAKSVPPAPASRRGRELTTPQADESEDGFLGTFVA